MTDAEQLEATVATEVQRLARMATIGDRATAGPADAPAAVSPTNVVSPRWINGWWADAIRCPAHAGRVGGPINPWAVVVHTTDVPAADFTALNQAWQTRSGDGACAHFLIGRTPHDGVLQLIAINRNANHAGGPGHGVFDIAAAKNIHPNLVTVGIELHCAGGVRQIGGAWRFVEDGVAHGAVIPDSDVIPDPARPGRGWHVVTPYQYEQLAKLRADLELVLAPLPAGAVARSAGEAVPKYAQFASARIVAHASLDPEHRADCWPPTCDWIRANG